MFLRDLSLPSQQDDSHSIYKLATSDLDRTLNTSEISKCVQRPGNEVAEDLRKLILEIYADNLSSDGRSVDYKGIGASEAFKVNVKLCEVWNRMELCILTAGAVRFTIP